MNDFKAYNSDSFDDGALGPNCGRTVSAFLGIMS